MKPMRSSALPAAPPSTVIFPAVGSESPSIMRTLDVFPAPFGPRNPQIVPRFTSKLRSRTASKSP